MRGRRSPSINEYLLPPRGTVPDTGDGSNKRVTRFHHEADILMAESDNAFNK